MRDHTIAQLLCDLGGLLVRADAQPVVELVEAFFLQLFELGFQFIQLEFGRTSAGSGESDFLTHDLILTLGLMAGEQWDGREHFDGCGPPRHRPPKLKLRGTKAVRGFFSFAEKYPCHTPPQRNLTFSGCAV